MFTGHNVQMIRGGKQHGKWRATRIIGEKFDLIGIFDTEKQANEALFPNSISKTVVMKAFRKKKIDKEEWAQISRDQVKAFSEIYR